MHIISRFFFGFIFLLCVLNTNVLCEQIIYASKYLTQLTIHRNFHEVIPERLYRSAEMNQEQLAATIDKYDIQTVIDLRRGNNPEEAKLVESKNILYFHRPFVSSKASQKERIIDLINIFDKAKAPVLIHCTSGTHRTGFATVLWLHVVENVPMIEATNQLHLQFGYFLPERIFSEIAKGHRVLEAVLDDYEKEHYQSGMKFRHWIQHAEEIY